MSLSEILSNALSGLNAAQSGLRTASNNIANVNTPGYARERSTQSTAVSSGRTTGVVVGEPSRVADRFLENAVYSKAGDAGRSSVTSDYLDRLQALLGSIDSTTAVPGRLNAIASAGEALGGQNNNSNGVFVAAVSDAISSMKSLSSDVSGLRSDVEAEVGNTVDRINALLQTVDDLNGSMVRLTALNRSTSGVADRRMAALTELSGLIGVTARDQPDGSVSIETSAGQQLLDTRLRQLSYASSGSGATQSVYPPIEIRFTDDKGKPAAATGEKIDSSGVGGKLGGLINLRDNELPGVADRIETLFEGIGQALNAASNANAPYPPPQGYTGRTTALTASDALHFTGQFSVTRLDSSGKIADHMTIDLSNMSTIADVNRAITSNPTLKVNATFANGKLEIGATDPSDSVIISQDPTDPSARSGIGFAQYFGLNDLVESDIAPLVPSGFTSTDRHMFGATQTTELALRDTAGRILGRTTIQPSANGTFGDIVTSLNTGSLQNFGSFALDGLGRLVFTPNANNAGAHISVLSDSTSRADTGVSLSTILGLPGSTPGLVSGRVRPDIMADSKLLSLGQITDFTTGKTALGTNNKAGASLYNDSMKSNADFLDDGAISVSRYAALTFGRIGTTAQQASDRATETEAARDEATSRRDSFSGVNVDEELGQLVVLQNSYSAAARVLNAVGAMFDALLSIKG